MKLSQFLSDSVSDLMYFSTRKFGHTEVKANGEFPIDFHVEKSSRFFEFQIFTAYKIIVFLLIEIWIHIIVLYSDFRSRSSGILPVYIYKSSFMLKCRSVVFSEAHSVPI